MTRAKRKLVLSAGLPAGLQADSFLSSIANRLGLDLREWESLEPDQELACGEERIHLSVRKENRSLEQWAGAEPTEWRMVDDLDNSLVTKWAERRRRYADLSVLPVFLTPTMLRQDDHGSSVMRRRGMTERDESLHVGTIVHRFLERWDFGCLPTAFHDQFDRLVNQELTGIRDDRREALYVELCSLLSKFVSLPIYQDLQRATILGREVPFLMSWGDQGQIMSGTIDLLYRIDGQVWVADYKTDALEAADVPTRIDQYRLQATIYAAAISGSLGIETPSFQFIFLRPGVVVTV
jgi:ATP-dependent helicase/nuclease subunit A